MNILVFSWRDPRHPLAGGAEQVMHEHMKGWVRGGHKVTLFSSRFGGSLKEESIDAVKIVRSGNQYHLGVQLAGFFYYLKNKNRYDFVVDQFHGMPFFTPLYVNKPKLAVIQETAREVWFLNPLPWPVNWIYGLVGYILEPFVFLFYKRTPFMLGSASAKEDISKLGIPKENITIVPHGVIARKPIPFPRKERRTTVVFLGVLTKDKGVEDAIRCFWLLRNHSVFRFWIIGRPETESYFKKLKRLVKLLELEKEVKFWGFVSQEKKFELLARSHILINPSVREGWGLVNIEANAMGIPIAAYNSPGLVDSVKDGFNGIICKQNTPREMARNVIEILDDKNYSSFSQNSIKWSKKFSWEKSCKISNKLIQEVANTA